MFSNETEMGWIWLGGEVGRNWESGRKENHNQDILYVRKESVCNKRKKLKNSQDYKKKRAWISQDMASQDGGGFRAITGHSNSYTGLWGHLQTHAVKSCASLPDVFARFQKSCIVTQMHLGIYQ